MTQIYVVMSQENFMLRSKGIPIAAYPDYPSALKYAQSIFRPVLGVQENPRDLVFLIAITPTTSVPPTTVPVAS